MLFAYGLQFDAPAGAALSEAARALAGEYLLTGELPFSWEAEGARGYRLVADRAEALATVACLRRLSARFPEVTVMLSGWGELPMTEIRAGEIQLHASAYAEALARHERKRVHALPRRTRH